MVDEMYQLKWEYNNTLNRYYNGCNYIEEHTNECDKYIGKVLELRDKLNELLNKIDKLDKRNFITDDEILGGFKLC